jgi:F-type H+-transporting ATPase subunit delta
MSNAAIADRYARAIFELGDETGQLAQMSEQVQRVASVFESSEELRHALDNPVVDDQKRDALIKDLGTRLGLSQHAQNAIRLLAARRRLRALPEIARALRRLADEKAGVLRATVTSAQPLSEVYYQKLVSELERVTQRKILLEKQQDPSLIAGVVTTIGDHTIDGSLKGRLAALERQLSTA